MRFFLDTNVFYGDWFARSANFRYLAHFINNEGHELLLSRLVVQELENIHQRELDNVVAEVRKNFVTAERLNGRSVFSPELPINIEPYNFLDILKERVESITVLEYCTIPQTTVAARALKKIRPFQDNDKGYRDTLIWLSLIDHLRKDSSTDEVVFISANKADFYDPSQKIPSFHSDLLEDIRSSGPLPNIRPYVSLFDYVDKTIDKNTNALDRTKAESTFGDYIEEEGVEFLENLQEIAVQAMQEILLPGTLALSNVISISAEVVEGLEDMSVLSTSAVDGDEVFVSCRYDLRVVELAIEIPKTDYQRYQTQIDSTHRFYEIEPRSSSVCLKTCIRPYFTVSFLHNVPSGCSKGFAVDKLEIR